MNPKTLEALLIDRALGELPSETEALLEAWLAHDESARRLSEQVGEVLAVTGDAVAARPDLFREDRLAGEAHRDGNGIVHFPPRLLRISVAAAALLVAGFAGFFAGSRHDVPVPIGKGADETPPALFASGSATGPWARYRLSDAVEGGLAVETTLPTPTPENEP